MPTEGDDLPPYFDTFAVRRCRLLRPPRPPAPTPGPRSRGSAPCRPAAGAARVSAGRAGACAMPCGPHLTHLSTCHLVKTARPARGPAYILPSPGPAGLQRVHGAVPRAPLLHRALRRRCAARARAAGSGAPAGRRSGGLRARLWCAWARSGGREAAELCCGLAPALPALPLAAPPSWLFRACRRCCRAHSFRGNAVTALNRPPTFPPPTPAGTKVEEARSLLESAVHFMESTFKAVWDGSIQEQPAKLQGGRGRVGLGGAEGCCWRAPLRAVLGGPPRHGVQARRGCGNGAEARGGSGLQPAFAAAAAADRRCSMRAVDDSPPFFLPDDAPPSPPSCSRGGRHGAHAAAHAGPAGGRRDAADAPGPRAGGLCKDLRRAARPRGAGGRPVRAVGKGWVGCVCGGGGGGREASLSRWEVCVACRSAMARLLAAAGPLSTLHVPVCCPPGSRAASLPRVFDMLVNNLPLEAGGQQPPPGKPPPGWRESMHARQFLSSEAAGGVVGGCGGGGGWGWGVGWRGGGLHQLKHLSREAA